MDLLLPASKKACGSENGIPECLLTLFVDYSRDDAKAKTPSKQNGVWRLQQLVTSRFWSFEIIPCRTSTTEADISWYTELQTSSDGTAAETCSVSHDPKSSSGKRKARAAQKALSIRTVQSMLLSRELMTGCNSAHWWTLFRQLKTSCVCRGKPKQTDWWTNTVLVCIIWITLEAASISRCSVECFYVSCGWLIG